MRCTPTNADDPPDRRGAGGTQGHPRPLRPHQGPWLQAEGSPRPTGAGDRLHAPEPALRLQDDGGPGGLRRRAEVPGGRQPGLNSKGFQFYLADHPEDERLFNTGQQDVAYRHFLDWLGGLLSEEIGVLFNPNDPANRLYPPQQVLDDVLALLNSDGIKRRN